MRKDIFIFEVSDNSFDKYVIDNSNKMPVFVVFMGVWSEHCAHISDMFASLAKEFAGKFIFAKVDIDENSQLKEKYKIINVPSLKVLVDGQVVESEEGTLTEIEARELLKRYGIVNEIDEMRMQARQYHIEGDTSQAIILLSQAMKKDTSNIKVAMDMVQIFIDIGEIDQANSLFNQLPDADKKSETGQSLSGQLWIIGEAKKTAGLQALKETLLSEPDNMSARFDCSICEIAQHNIQQGLEHLFYIQKNDPEFKGGAAKEMIISIINLLAKNDPEKAQQYRTQLSSLMAV